MTDMFWCVTLSLLVLRIWWKYRPMKSRHTKVIMPSPVDAVTKASMETERQRRQDEADLRKQGYSDEVIATILPIIQN